MEQIGSQVRLPFRRAMQIAVQGIRIRLGRSLVTVSGVVLGIAFLMSNLTAQLIKTAVSQEEATRQKVNLMLSLVKSEVGDLTGKRLAIAAFGTLSEAERTLVRRVVAAGPAELKGSGLQADGVKPAEWKNVAAGAALLLVLGDGTQAPASLSDLTATMTQKVVLDSLAERAFAGQPDRSVRRELFFGEQTDEWQAKLQREARQARFRTLWIVAISLLVTAIGVSNALLMSVTERFREIGTMKCLGALSAFIRRLFLIESSVIGLAGSALGVVLGALLTLMMYAATYGFVLVFGSISYPWLLLAGVAAVIAGTLLAILAAIYPASFAARMVPASALRSTV